jgi:hypothetical protein
MAHHDADSVVILKRLGCEIAEHPQMAVLAIHAIFRGVMGMDRSHSWTDVSIRSIAHIPFPYRQGFTVNPPIAVERVSRHWSRW